LWFDNKTLDLNDLSFSTVANSRIMFDDLAGVSSSDLMPDEINTLKPIIYSLLSGLSAEVLYLKTHEKYGFTSSGNPMFPVDHSLCCIYIVRNPLDVADSVAHYFGIPLDHAITSMNNPSKKLHSSTSGLWPLLEEHLGTWSGHVESWLHGDLPVFILRYEDMKENPVETFSSALEFLQLRYSSEQIRKALYETSFGRLQELEQAKGFSEKIQGRGAFFRSGSIGGWKDTLTNEQIKKIRKDHATVMKMFNYL
jgi:hypothetical protein